MVATAEDQDEQPQIPEPPDPTREWVRFVVAFSVGVALGLVPFVGYIDVPGFTALVEVFPPSMRSQLFAFAALVMGTVAACVQFLGGKRTRSGTRSALFVVTVVLFLIAMVATMFVVEIGVEVVNVRATNERVAVVVGLSERPASCEPCPAPMSNVECIENEIGISEAAIASCFGDRATKLASFVLQLSYVATMGLFGAMIGFVTLREAGKRGRKRER